ncbi:cell division protein ZapE [Longimonas halophila]|uniref:Cell division protein ZapE n=1 Tax=Longimonas halophila TaxID=1469170 RepID=A0A2H3NY70_9BACT|nr:AFG1/ZapE family ATPase [Longimonas halophila]PEN07677.1 cell division protein ZapE [Longimonas halophila]
MDLSLPPRFESATFVSYVPTTTSQAEACRAVQAFVDTAPWDDSWMRTIWNRHAGTVRQRGLYLVGPVGTGKTHLMAAAYQALHPATPCGFVHSRTLFQQTASPQAVARSIADQCTLLCLDEVEIDDPANEARLVHTLQALDDVGVYLLASSNVRPEAFAKTNVGPTRFEHFLRNAFGQRYALQPVEGPDYRRDRAVQHNQTGTIWVGPPDATRERLDAACQTHDTALRLSFDALRERSRTTAHDALVDELVAPDCLAVEDVALDSTDDALRLLRIVDALYTHDAAPVLYMTARTPPDDWFAPEQFAGLAQAIAKKFTRTVSRLHALCTVEHVARASPKQPTKQR